MPWNNIAQGQLPDRIVAHFSLHGSECPESPLHMTLALGNLLPSLLHRHGWCRRGQMATDFVKRYFLRRDAGPLVRSGCLTIRPPRREEAFTMAAGVEPVGDAWITVGYHQTDHAVRVYLRLVVV